MEAVVGRSESYSKAFSAYIFPCKCPLHRVIGLVQGLWLLLHYDCWTLIGTPLGYPVVALCHGGPAALGLQDLSLHMLQQITDGLDVGVGQLIALILGLGGFWVSQPASCPSHPHHQVELSSIALTSSP